MAESRDGIGGFVLKVISVELRHMIYSRQRISRCKRKRGGHGGNFGKTLPSNLLIVL